MIRSYSLSVAALGMILLIGACQTAYYNFWEHLGKEKRDLLVDNVEEVREDQKGVSEEFKDALTKLRELYRVPDTDLAKTYDALQTSYDRSKEKAEELSGRIAKVERIADDLFAEWRAEAQTIENPKFRQDSLAKLATTKTKFKAMKERMEGNEKRIAPVLVQLRDHVLYLKHNLNAQAIGALKGEYGDIKRDIESLISEMQASIKASDEFIDTLR